MRPLIHLLLGCALLVAPAAHAVTQAPEVKEGDFIVRDFRFGSGERLPELRMHYRTLGVPRKDARGRVDNAVMILHGTGGSGAQFLQPQFADELFGPGQPLDTSRHYIILPDNIGHGGSSKPSDGLRMRFPKYDYDDMVEAQRRLLADGLGVERLRLMFGTSMGCMHIFVWAQKHPQAARAFMPMACQPAQIAGRNRLWRKAAMDALRADPAWQQGDYAQPPLQGMRTASSLTLLAGAAPWYMQAQYPDRDSVDRYFEERIAQDLARRDANDFLYQLDASRNYDPSSGLAKIVAPMTWINSADDFINPPELGLAERALPRLRTTRYVLIPQSADTRGHGTHTWAKFWKQELVDLLKRSE